MTLTGRVIIFLLLLIPAISFAQDGTLTGTVRDKETKETLPGATVQLVGTYKGSATDLDGKFTIEGIKPGDYTVKVSFLGYSDKVYNGVRIEAGKVKVLEIVLESRATALEAVDIVGDKNLVDLESGSSEVKIGQEEIKEMAVRNVQDIVQLQAGVNKTPDGLQIRGGRVYETQYLVDGISAQDPLAGTGFGVEVSSNALSDVKVITGGAGAEYGDGSSGVVAASIRDGGDRFAVSGTWQRDNLGFNVSEGSAWNTDVADLAVGGPVPFTKKKTTFFTSAGVYLTDDYYRVTARQLHSSLFPGNDSIWAPRQNNKWTNTFKIAHQFKPGTKLSLTNQHSLAINQNTRSLQIVGFDAIVTPGLQYEFINLPDNATTYTHSSNLTILQFSHYINKSWNFNASLGRLFTNLRADANGRPFRENTVDQVYDPQSIVTDPVSVYNPEDSIVFVYPGPGLVNNNGISTLWHDHYAQEYTIKARANYYTTGRKHDFSFGMEHKELEYQWADVTRPWVGAPIQVNDTLTTPSISIGSSNDIWKVKPAQGGLYVQDDISYKGIQATIGVRFNYWAYGSFADQSVSDSTSILPEKIKQDYIDATLPIAGRRFQGRILPRLRVSFPVTENNVLYFNYGHAMKLPHPRFIYAGLDPVYQDRSFLSRLGNPSLRPEVTVSYELGIKSQITRNLGLTFTAFNNDKYDYIVTRTVQVQDQTGRFVEKTFNINQDYAKVVGLELGIYQRIGRHFRLMFNGAYQVATGKSNSAAESLLQIKQQGYVNTTKEQFLAWDRPWDLKLAAIFRPDTTFPWAPKVLKGFSVYLASTFKSGLRYTPYELTGYNDAGRPLYQRIDEKPYSELGKPWIWTDLRITRDFRFGKYAALSLSIEIKNLFNNRNSQIINPVTGRAYEYGDPLPADWRDPAYPDPQDYGVPPYNPARYLEPRHILYGISFRF